MNYSRRDMLRDGLAMAGTGMIGAGCYLVHPPLALIVPGALFLAAAVWRR